MIPIKLPGKYKTIFSKRKELFDYKKSIRKAIVFPDGFIQLRMLFLFVIFGIIIGYTIQVI